MKALPLVLSLAVMVVIWLTGLTQTLGAHPWWSGTVVLIGAPVGLGLAVALGFILAPRWRAALFAAATLAAEIYIPASGAALGLDWGPIGLVRGAVGQRELQLCEGRLKPCKPHPLDEASTSNPRLAGEQRMHSAVD